MRSPLVTRRALLRRTAAACLSGSIATPCRAAPDDIERAIGRMLLLGFSGHTDESPTARTLATQLRDRQVAGVVFVKENVGTTEELAGLLRLFAPQRDQLVAIDHEGGAVQRLVERHGVARLPKALIVARQFSPAEATTLYADAGKALRRFGFNLNLGPVVDLHDPQSAAVGHYGRSFGEDPATVETYASAFIDGFASAGVTCALKHFPGAGHVQPDSHFELPDGSATWTPVELEPFSMLIKSGKARVIMAAHMKIAALEPRPLPVTFSAAVMTKLLRDRLGFNGVAMTDDLDMEAIRSIAPRKEAVVQAIAAGCDLLMIRNVKTIDPTLPQNVVAWVKEAIAAGRISRSRIAQAAARVAVITG